MDIRDCGVAKQRAHQRAGKCARAADNAADGCRAQCAGDINLPAVIIRLALKRAVNREVVDVSKFRAVNFDPRGVEVAADVQVADRAEDVA